MINKSEPTTSNFDLTLFGKNNSTTPVLRKWEYCYDYLPLYTNDHKTCFFLIDNRIDTDYKSFPWLLDGSNGVAQMILDDVNGGQKIAPDGNFLIYIDLEYHNNSPDNSKVIIYNVKKKKTRKDYYTSLGNSNSRCT